MTKEQIAAILLVAGCPALLMASTLTSRVECRVDVQAKQITPIKYRAEAFPLLLALAAGQGVMAWKLLRGDRQKAESTIAGELPPSDCPELAEMPVASPQTPIPVVADLPAQAPHPVQTHAVVETANAAPEQASKPKATEEPSFMRRMAASPLSNVFSAPPGTGKTTTELAWLAHVFSNYHDAIALIACWKMTSG